MNQVLKFIIVMFCETNIFALLSNKINNCDEDF